MTTELLRKAAALAYVEDLTQPALSDQDSHHLSTALRLRDGELVVAGDGHGSYRPCSVACAATGRRRAQSITLEPIGEIEYAAAPAVPITVAFSLAKGDRTEWAVAKLVELGVDRIVPLACARTVVRPAGGADEDGRAGRLRRIARESAMQARLAYLPEVSSVLEPAELLGPGVALAEPAGTPPLPTTTALLVGPEGGWAPSELGLGLPTVTLGGTILRIETAAIAAGVLLTGLRSGLVRAAQR
ncbi:MAG: RsmE family RNA methyltransferase [Acidimicrobiales bacterium]